jgi:glyceraldehyde-3-phosphate dehydrogenase (NADP+)
MTQEHKLLIAGEWETSESVIDVIDPYSRKVAWQVSEASPEQVERAMAAAHGAADPDRMIPAHQRKAILHRTSEIIRERKEELAKIITTENGKTRRYALGEVLRAVLTFQLAADETTNIHGEVLQNDIVEGMGYRWVVVKRYPIGPVLAIAPFNFPLNLVAHKVAPAIAAGNPVIIKPSSLTPLTALKLGEILLEAGLPKDWISVLPLKGRKADPLVTDDRIKILTFTGSAEVGWALKARAGKKRVTLELGGTGPVIVASDADLVHAARRSSYGAFAYSGQICISTQRIIVEEPAYDEFKEHFLEAVGMLRIGDPSQDNVDMGPVIDEENAARVESWIKAGVEVGAKVLHGGKREGTLMEPTVVEDVPLDADLYAKEVFGPVAVLVKARDLDEAIELANDTPYGLQAGFFGKDMSKCMLAADRLRYGGVMINESSVFRVDNMPFGGTKESGLGREGLKYAIEEMTEPKTIVLTKV